MHSNKLESDPTEPRRACCAQPAAYDSEADHYDEIRFASTGGRLSSDLDDAIVKELLAPIAGRTFLDMPAGTGRSSVALARDGAHVYAVDISFEMLIRAREKAAAEKNLAIEFVQADATSMPFPDNYFDGICCLRLFHLITPEARLPFMKEFHRVLKPGGVLVAEFPRRLHAGGLLWITGKITHRRRWHFLLRKERSSLFQGFNLIKTLGGYFPLIRLVAKASYDMALKTNLLISHSFLKVFSRQAFLMLRKDG